MLRRKRRKRRKRMVESITPSTFYYERKKNPKLNWAHEERKNHEPLISSGIYKSVVRCHSYLSQLFRVERRIKLK